MKSFSPSTSYAPIALIAMVTTLILTCVNLHATDHSGTISTNTTWFAADNPHVIVSAQYVAGARLTIEPGSLVQIRSTGALFVVNGTVRAVGSESQPITFTRAAGTNYGGRIGIYGSSYNLQATGTFERCNFSYLYGNPAAFHTLYADFKVANCNFTNFISTVILPENSAISIVNNYINNTGEGINARSCKGVIGTNRISNINGYADAIDLDYAWEGPSYNDMIVEGNVLSYAADEDADGIDLGTATSIVRNNIIRRFGDKGISVGEATGNAEIRNNLIDQCTLGIGIKDGSAPVIANCIIVRCTNGIASYEKNSGMGGGRGSFTNGIIWGCGVSISLDASSTISVGHSDIEGGWTGKGNINSDPRFVDLASSDCRLSAMSPCINAATNQEWMIDVTDVAGNPRIAGDKPDMGAYEYMEILKVALPTGASEGDGLLAGQGSVIIPLPQSSNIVVALSVDDTSELTITNSVTILAGQTSVAFDLNVINDNILDGSQKVKIMASYPSFLSASNTIMIHDNETAALGLAVAPDSTTEISGVLTAQGTATINQTPTVNIAVDIVSSRPGEVSVTNVVILAGETNVNFDLAVIDDNRINGNRAVTITAHVQNWTDDFDTITLNDNETTNITLIAPALVTESDGTLPSAAAVYISGTLESNLTVYLLSSDTTEAQVAGSVIIAAGQTNKAFNVVVMDDTLADGTQTVSISASAAGLAGTNALVAVRDNGATHFTFAPVSSPQTGGIPFAVTISAREAGGAISTLYHGTANFSASGAHGGLTMTPSSSTAFSNGVWTGTVRFGGLDNNVQIIANDSAGRSATSTVIDVISGPLDHFSWSTISSPQIMSNGFPVTITAQDVVGNIATQFTDSVSIMVNTSSNIAIGSGNVQWLFLMYTVGHDDRTQVIYLTNEIGKAYSMTSLALNVSTPPNQTMTNWTIRLKHTALDSYDGNSIWESGWTTVYQTNEPVGTTGWRTFAFNAPFAYNGTDNLMVDFSFNNDSSLHTLYGICLATDMGQDRLIFRDTDSAYGDPLTWTGTNPVHYTAQNVPNLILGAKINEFVTITPTNTQKFVAGVWSGTITVWQAANDLSLRIDDGNNHTRLSNPFNVITGGLHQITATAGTSGSIAPSGSVQVASGEDVSFAILANAYYHIADILTNGATIGGPFGMSSNNFIWANVMTNGTLMALFAENLATNQTPQWWLASCGLTNRTWDIEALDDQDGDGMATWKEYVAGTSPTNSAECLNIKAITPHATTNNSPIVITWDTVTGRFYKVTTATNTASPWNPVSDPAFTNIPGPGSRFAYTNNSQNDAHRFFRINVRKP